jgi:hypothetical protein
MTRREYSVDLVVDSSSADEMGFSWFNRTAPHGNEQRVVFTRWAAELEKCDPSRVGWTYLAAYTDHSYRVQDSHLRNSDFTKGVRRVRLNWSPSLRMASACVGYG